MRVQKTQIHRTGTIAIFTLSIARMGSAFQNMKEDGSHVELEQKR